MSNHTLLDHIVSQTRQNVELLMSHNKISPSDGRDILLKLPSTGVAGSMIAITQQTQRLSISPAPAQSLMINNNAGLRVSPKLEARAIWDWESEDPNDLSFHAGDIIEIVKETNVDWWTGRIKSGKQGLFPSTYVERLAPRSVSPPPMSFPEFQKTGTSSDSKYGLASEPKYMPPGLPGPPQYSSPQPVQQPYPPPPGPPPGPPTGGYPAPPASGYLSPGPPVGGYPPPSGPLVPPYNSYSGNPPVAQPVPQQPPKKGRFGNLGTMMAQSAAGGLGFGAGAAIGGDIVNSIF
ncbi:SH3-domain-containing protein [Suillus subalutaceus]|uniref:SH3-domain-containing protein n=1 Tax=Suillus subalutaceus TaxID=48586 RepID=UPI001B871900|nr:SH3-domain-containing protein [Suillus subalutaceus]KAG1851611.1 SH3-domain-containing protein [Suillus subalutaceus]